MCCQHFKIILCSFQADGRIAVTLQTPLTCLELEGAFIHHSFKKYFPTIKNALLKNQEGKKQY